jgi:uncharacterized protein (TIGR02266 family)
MPAAPRLADEEFAVDDVLKQAEAELAEEEATLLAEVSRLTAAAADVERRLRAVRKTASEGALSGVRDGALDARLKLATLPSLDARAAFQRALQARQAAVDARREVAVEVRQLAEAAQARLASLAQQLQGDEKAAHRLSTMAKLKAKAAAEEEAEVVPEPEAGDDLDTGKTLPPGVLPPVAPPAALKPKPKAAPAAAAQRGSKRVKMQASVDLSSDDNFFNGFSSNISDGGLFVATVNLVPLGTEVDLHFTLPSGEKLDVHGVVRWHREVNDAVPDAFPGLGVQFTRLDGPAQKAIASFVADREPMFYAE